MKRNKEKENKLTHKELTRLLEYSSSTGEFKWKVSRQRMRAGSIAGWNLGGYKAIKINLHKWQAYISLDGDQEHLGIFDDMKDAMEARKQKEKEYGYHKNHGRIKYAI
jgi:hypothetical protein